MIFGMTPLTFVHVVISLIGIGSGLMVVYGLLAAKRLEVWTAIFLTTTVLTSVTGFFFPIERFTPGIGIGIISLIVLAIAMVVLYVRQLAGFWRQRMSSARLSRCISTWWCSSCRCLGKSHRSMRSRRRRRSRHSW